MDHSPETPASSSASPAPAGRPAPSSRRLIWMRLLALIILALAIALAIGDLIMGGFTGRVGPRLVRARAARRGAASGRADGCTAKARVEGPRMEGATLTLTC